MASLWLYLCLLTAKSWSDLSWNRSCSSGRRCYGHHYDACWKSIPWGGIVGLSWSFNRKIYSHNRLETIIIVTWRSQNGGRFAVFWDKNNLSHQSQLWPTVQATASLARLDCGLIFVHTSFWLSTKVRNWETIYCHCMRNELSIAEIHDIIQYLCVNWQYCIGLRTAIDTFYEAFCLS